MQDTTAKIFVAGHRGLVGSNIFAALQNAGYTNLLTATRQEVDLTDQQATFAFFEREKPEYAIIAAAKVGGIGANKTYPADFIYQNLQMACNIIHAAHTVGVKKLLYLGSSCIYPKLSPQPMKPEYVFTGHLDPNVAPYAVAKIAALQMCQSYRAQYGDNFIYATPANLYGVNDNFDLETSHVLPALLRKIHEAKERGDSSIEIWGDGSPKREFMLADDLAEACVFLMQHYNGAENINIGSGEETSIKNLAETIREVIGWKGDFEYDTSKPAGTPRKLLDAEPLTALGYTPKHTLKDGIRYVYEQVFLQPGGPTYTRN